MKSFLHLFCIGIAMLSTAQVLGQCFTEQAFTSSGTHTYTIPGTSSEIYTIEIECQGADGAPSFLNGGNPNQGGSGALMAARYNVVGGDVLTIFVGQSGLVGGNPAGGGGGGGTAVIINSSEVLIAAGAGGGGGLGGASGTGFGGEANTDSPAQGGTGVGAPGGGGFNDAGDDGQAGTGGGAGTLTTIGAGGTGGVVAGMGGQGFGGGGGGAGTVGGGGGGYEGGAGGLESPQGGMGGDSYVTTDFSSMLILAVPGVTAGGSQSDGYVTIVCISTGGSDLAIMLEQMTDPNCAGAAEGSITVSASNGSAPYQFSIDGVNFQKSGTFNNLSAGMYTVTAMDAVGSMISTNVTLTDPDGVVASSVIVTDNVCFGEENGSISVTASGGAGNYMYSLDGGTMQGSGEFANLASQDYIITIIDGEGCSVDTSVTVTGLGEIQLTADVSDVLCAGGTTGNITASASGGTPGYMFSLDGVNYQFDGTFNSLSAQVYTVYVQDASGCVVEEAVSIDEPESLDLMTAVTNAGCSGEGGSIMATASGGTAPYIFTLNEMNSSKAGFFDDLPAGEYSVAVTDENGCMTSATVQLNAVGGDSLQLVLNQSSDVSCFGLSDGSIDVSINNGAGPFTYMIDTVENSTGVFTDLPAGSYTVSATDEGGCSTSLQVTLTQPEGLGLSITTTNGITCAGGGDGEIELSGFGGTPPYTFTLSDTIMSNAGVFTGLFAGDYSVIITDSKGCFSNILVSLNDPEPVVTAIVSVTNITCPGGSDGVVNISGAGGSAPYTFALNDTIVSPDGIFSGLSAGDYSATITDSLGCTGTIMLSLTQPEALLVVIDTITGVPCGNAMVGSAEFSGAGGTPPYTYTLNDTITSSNGIFTDLIPGQYTATVIDSNGCMTSQTIVVPIISSFSVSLLDVIHVACFGESSGQIVLSVFGDNQDYILILGEDTLTVNGLDTVTIGGLPAGTYSPQLIDETGCIHAISFEVEQPDELVVGVDSFENPSDSTSGSVTLVTSGGVAPYQFSIDNGATFQSDFTFTGLTEAAYLFTVQDANGCTSTVAFIFSSTSVDEILDDSIIVYPNPAKDHIFLSLSRGIAEIKQAMIIDLTGRTRKVQLDPFQNSSQGQVFHLNCENLNSGMYYLMLQTKDGVVAKQFAVER